MSTLQEDEELEMTTGGELIETQPGPLNENLAILEGGDASSSTNFDSGRNKRYEYRQERKLNDDLQMDKELQELGLLEEDMTREQKIELLRVLAVSRETAQMEEMLRKSQFPEHQEQDWLNKGTQVDQPGYYSPEKIVPEALHETAHLGTVQQKSQDPETAVNTVWKKTVEWKKVDPTQFSGERGAPHTVTRSYAEVLKAREMKAEVTLESDEDTVPPPSPDNTNLPKAPQVLETYSGTQGSIVDCDDSSVRTLRYVSQLKKVTDPKYFSSKSQLCEPTLAMETVLSLEFNRKTPSPALENNRLPTGEVIPERVPFFCPPGEDPSMYVEKILNSMDQFHDKLLSAQKESGSLRLWGEPVVVGRHHPNTIDFFRRGEQPRYWTPITELQSSPPSYEQLYSSEQELKNVAGNAEVKYFMESSKSGQPESITRDLGEMGHRPNNSPPYLVDPAVPDHSNYQSATKRETGTRSPTLVSTDETLDVVGTTSTMNCMGTKRQAEEEDHHSEETDVLNEAPTSPPRKRPFRAVNSLHNSVTQTISSQTEVPTECPDV